MLSPKPGVVVLVALLAFASLGLPDAVLGVGWPSVRRTFGLPMDRLGLWLAAMMVGYLVSSISSGAVVARIGLGRLLAASSLAVAVASLGYAAAPAWWWMVACGLLVGLGAGAIDAGINAFAAANFSTRWVTWLHACYGVGAMLGPLLMTAVLSTGFSWRAGYLLLGGLLAAMAVCFVLTTDHWGPRASTSVSTTNAPQSGLKETALALRQPIVGMHTAFFLVYTGLEVTVGQWSYSLLTESRGWSMQAAGLMVSLYWASLTIGRVIFGLIGPRFNPEGFLRIVIAGAALGAGALWLLPDEVASGAALMNLGFFLAPIYPLMIWMTPRRVGKRFAAHAIGLQVSSAYVGAALVPALVGWLATQRTLEIIGPFTALLALLLLVLHEIARRFGMKPEVQTTMASG